MNKRRMLGAGLVVSAALAACSKNPPENLLPQAEFLVLEQRYDEAIPVLKQQLLNYPEDAGAHYYLGRCYLFSWLMVAHGEFETALALFRKQGRKPPIERFGAEYFELSCHLEMAKVSLRQIQKLLEYNASPEYIEDALRQAENAYAGAKTVAPDAAEVKELEALLSGIRENARQHPAGIPPPAPKRTYTL